MMLVSKTFLSNCNPKNLPIQPIMCYKPDPEAAPRHRKMNLNRNHRVGFVAADVTKTSNGQFKSMTTLAEGYPRNQVSLGTVPHPLGGRILVVFQTESTGIFIASLDYRDLTFDIPGITYNGFTSLMTDVLRAKVDVVEKDTTYDPGELAITWKGKMITNVSSIFSPHCSSRPRKS